MKAKFLPWKCKVEESIKNILNQKGYLKYGQHIFRVGSVNHIESHRLLHSGSKDDTRPMGTDLLTCNKTTALSIFCNTLYSSFLNTLTFSL